MSNHARRPKRLLAGMLAGALALSVTPILGFTGVASADHIAVAEPIGEGNFCENVPDQEPFTDVETTDPSYDEIVCLVATEITTGVTTTTYEPNSFVTRRQMALFLVRAAEEANRLEVDGVINELPAPAETDFTDTDDEEQFIEDAISQLEQAEIAAGFPDNSYRPEAPVSRRQMAAFIDRLYEYLTGEELPATEDYFEDDEADSAEAQGSTNAVAEAGIFVGNEDGTFRPAQEITRRQMANVLTRFLEVLFENGFITQWAAEEAPQDEATVAAADVEDGQFVLTVAGEDVEAVTVTGDCLTDQTFAVADDEDAATAGNQFTVVLDADAAAGDCVATVVTSFTEESGLEDETDTVTVVVPEGPTTNQSFAVTPAGNQQDPTGGTDVDFTVAGIDTATVDIALVPCENVTVDENGVVTFADADNTTGDTTVLEGNNQADGLGDTPADFTAINGGTIGGDAGDTGSYQNDVNVVNGAVTFSVNSAEQDCVVAVIFDDANDNNQLDLDANNQPTEAFSVTGQINFTAPAAVSGAMDENVASTDKANNQFVGCELGGDPGAGATAETGANAVDPANCFLFTYDANDQFTVVTDGVTQTGQSLAQFEAQLSPGDDVSGQYNDDPAGVSTFVLTNEAPLAPEAVTATSTTTDTVTLTIDDSATPTVDSYNIYRANAVNGACPDPADGPTAANGFALVGNVADPTPTQDASTITFVDAGRTASTAYCYQVTSVDDGDESTDAAASANNGLVTTPATNPTDTVRPLAQDTELTTSAGFATLLDVGDVIQICFNEPLDAPDAGDALLVTDGNFDTAQLVNGQNAIFALGTVPTADVSGDAGATNCPANQTLVITITQPVADTNPNGGANDGIQIPTEITDSLGVTDVAGNNADFPNSPDPVIDVEGPEAQDVQSGGDATAPVIGAGNVAAADDTVVDFVSNEAIDPATFTTADITETSAAGVQGVAVSQDGRTLTVTFDAPLAGGETVTLEANSVADAAGNTAPVDDVTEVVTAPV